MKKFQKYVSLFLMLSVIGVGIFSALNIRTAENLEETIPGLSDDKNFKPLLEKGKRQIAFSLSWDAELGVPEEIETQADSLLGLINQQLSGHISGLSYRYETDPKSFSSFLNNQLPLLLDSLDYLKLDSLISAEAIHKKMKANKALLSSESGFFWFSEIANDPLGFKNLIYAKLGGDQSFRKILDNNGLFVSEEGNRLLILGELTGEVNNLAFTQKLKADLDALISQWNGEANFKADYFGTFLIPLENAQQIKADIPLTISLSIGFILSLLLFYFRKIKTLFFFLLPGVFGVSMAIMVLYFFKGSLSGIAFSASAIVFGVVVDYCFHFFSHLSQDKDPYVTRNKIALPLTVSSFTTVAAFFSLLLAQSSALKDFGLLAGLSLLGTLLFILLVLPDLIALFGGGVSFSGSAQIHKLIGKFDKPSRLKTKWVLPGVIIVTVFLGYFSTGVEFESDLNKINFYPKALQQREWKHQNIDPEHERRFVLISKDAHKDEAVLAYKNVYQVLQEKQSNLSIRQVGSVAPFLNTKNARANKLERWNIFWRQRLPLFESDFSLAAEKEGFNIHGFDPFLNNLKPSDPAKAEEFLAENKLFSNLMLDENTFLTSCVVSKADADAFKSIVADLPNTYLLDGGSVASKLVSAVKRDFDTLLWVAALLVFVTMLLVYGRIELALISFIPMVVSWIWILGLASLFGLKFNFINVMIATIIFGLGDDFAIFIMDGMLNGLKSRAKTLASHKASILLSSLSTVVAMAVLFFSGHPAIKSIAPISVIGISTIVLVSFVVQPLLFRLLIKSRIDSHRPPMRLLEVLGSVYSFSMFFVGCFLISIGSALLIAIPFLKKSIKKRGIHYLLKGFTWFLVYSSNGPWVNIKGRENLDFGKPSILIANHSSFLDILMTLMLSSRIVIMVGEWVYHSPLFGWFLRYADFLPAFKSVEENEEKIKELVKEGYSVLVFPEGRRSVDGELKRFHKGAFYLSEKLNLDITPILLHGLSFSLPKYDYYLKKSQSHITILPRINPEDTSFGEGYKARAKAISKFYKESWRAVRKQVESPAYFRYILQSNYLYKGPKLEWYFRVKYAYEKHNYALIEDVIGNRKKIYDLGCGYGFLSFYLKLKDPSREIVGVDYDEEKIEVAATSFLASTGVGFQHGDIREVQFENPEVIILSDVLHYLPSDDQIKVLNWCIGALPKSGVLLVKDGLKSGSEQHQWTEKSERWSTQLMKFNKVQNELHFFDKAFIQDWAIKNNLNLRTLSESKKSSNTLFLIEKN